MSKVHLITHDLLDHLRENMTKAKSCYILTSFVMKSGVKILEPLLREAAENGADVKICTGDYLYITQPDALKKLLSIHPAIETRIWNSNGVSFHPKAYIFENDDEGVFYIGSSNMSRSALTKGVEWNVAIAGQNKEEIFESVISEFISIYHNAATMPLNDITAKQYEQRYQEFHQRNPQLQAKWTQQEEIEMTLTAQENMQEELPQPDQVMETAEAYQVISPRFAQGPALEQLEILQEEGYNKAMVVMATGLGKTYLAAFFAKPYKRVLFIAHLEEILNQAAASFKNVITNVSTGIFNGKQKNPDASVVFASIQTLSRKRHLEVFSPDDFDLIIVDEFHHAAANSYQKVLDYFKPKFLLGITATPDRNDYRDIYAICDGNVAYRIEFIEAVQKEWLSPFHYFGIYDDTDYSQIKWLGTKYDAEQLAEAQLKESVAEKILDAWKKYKQTRTLTFCSSIIQANFLSDYFNRNGFRTVSLHSHSAPGLRGQAIKQLKEGQLDAIMTVNLFNEGVDIPQVDTLLFARPTESLTVFTQQIGRGLRLAEGKNHCVIIDLIANYRNADVKQSMFYLPQDSKNKKKKQLPVLPEGCEMHLDLEAKMLIDEMANKKRPRKEKLLQSYQQVKSELGRRPTYLEMHLHGSEDSRLFKQEFKSYFAFLKWAEELSPKETEPYDRYAEWFIEVESTIMSKSYKMVLLLSMLERGPNEWMKPITAQEAAPFFHQFLTRKEYRKRIDFSDKTTKSLWNYDHEKVASLIEKMPMTKWSGRSKGMIGFEGGAFKLKFDVGEEDQEVVYCFTKEICDYRLHGYFERKGNE